MQDLQASRCFNTYRILGDTDVLYGSDPLATEGDTPNLTARYLAPFRAHNHFSECGHGLSKVGPIIASTDTCYDFEVNNGLPDRGSLT